MTKAIDSIKNIFASLNRIEASLMNIHRLHRVKTSPARKALQVLTKETEALMALLEKKGIPMSGPNLDQEPPATP